ncbi:hypothetical protein KJ765_05250 [Candidatus Micrarchaeota archaeon]|nr:hypothetical protein [Candidatus Micrarchaeota archaeon]
MPLHQLAKTVSGSENPHWAFISRVLLRRATAEFSQSTHSVQWNGFVSPNRDYPYEGFSAVFGNENWKFLDALGLACTCPETRLTPLQVTAFPWKVTYQYAIHPSRNTTLSVEYYLLKSNPFPCLHVRIQLSPESLPENRLLIAPLLDMRPSDQSAFPYQYAVSNGSDQVIMKNVFSHYSLLMTSRGLKKTNEGFSMPWQYKLGSGEREGSSGFPKALSETRSLYCPGVYSVPLNRETVLQFTAYPSNTPPAHYSSDETRELKQLASLIRRLRPTLKKAEVRWGKGTADALAIRSLVFLDKFSFRSPFGAKDAGAYWFRQPWTRDLFESTYINYDAIASTKPDWMTRLISSTWSMQNNGFLPRLLNDPDSGQSVDGTLYALLTSHRFQSANQSPAFRERLLQAGHSFIEAVARQGMLDPHFSLLKTPADASWIDSRIPYPHSPVPIMAPSRLPAEWANALLTSSTNPSAAIQEPRYYLAEVNALWVEFLRARHSLKPSEATTTLKSNAAFQFKHVFFGEVPCGMARDDLVLSDEEVATWIQAAALAPSSFTDLEARELLDRADPYLVRRNHQLFGVLVKKGPRTPFFDDRQYHGAVAWPKTNPYLYSLLMRAGKTREAESLLLSVLDHQQNEGALFYTHELFSPEAQPVPVKNPAQLFSQYVQPYYDFLQRV